MRILNGILNFLTRRSGNAVLAGILFTKSTAFAQDGDEPLQAAKNPPGVVSNAYKKDPSYKILFRRYAEQQAATNRDMHKLGYEGYIKQQNKELAETTALENGLRQCYDPAGHTEKPARDGIRQCSGPAKSPKIHAVRAKKSVNLKARPAHKKHHK